MFFVSHLWSKSAIYTLFVPLGPKVDATVKSNIQLETPRCKNFLKKLSCLYIIRSYPYQFVPEKVMGQEIHPLVVEELVLLIHQIEL